MEIPKFESFNEEYKQKLYEYLIYSLPRLSEEDRKLITKAYNVAYEAHKNVFRKTGNIPYITHPVEVAIIVAQEMGFGATSIASALLHDVVEDNQNYDLKYIEKEFGKEIAKIVEGVTKITQIGNQKKSINIEDATAQRIYFINLLTTIPHDFRVLLIKVADRLHNMRTMDAMPEKSQKIKSAENMYIYAELARMAGLWKIKKELEDRSFKYLMPEQFENMLRLKKQYDNTLKVNIGEFQQKIRNFINTDYDFEIFTTQKSLYEIWQKITQEHIPYENIHNKYSTQIVVHVTHKDVTKELKVKRRILYDIYVQISNVYDIRDFKDWVKHPKKNGFSALVFDVMYEGKWQEVQLMTYKDFMISERGWYDKVNSAPGLINLQKDISKDISEVINQIESKLGPKVIYVFTPKGKKIELPEGATVLDFAFTIHRDIGLKCWGAILNEEDKRVPRSHKLKNMDQVNIQTIDYIRPTFEWLEQATMARTKKILRNYLKKNYPQQYQDYMKKKNKIKEIGFNSKKPILLDNSINFQMAKCCKPVIGEKCFVHRELNDMLVVHTATCSKTLNLLANDSSNIAIVEWGTFPSDFTVDTELELDGKDRRGIAEEIIDKIYNSSAFLTRITLEQIGEFFKGIISLKVHNLQELNEIIENISVIPDVYHIKRVCL